MDFIKKHYEKITLALTLLILIASAAILSFKVGSLSQEIQSERLPGRRGKGKPAQPVDPGTYNNALAALDHPPLWTNSPLRMFPPTTESPSIAATNTTLLGNMPVLVQIIRKPFNLLFMSYTGNGRNFQLNFLTVSRMFVVPDVGMEVGDQFSKTGYIIKKFEQKKTMVTDKNLGVQRENDASELTLQRQGEDPIILVLHQVTEQREPVAQILCKGSTQTQEVRRTQRFVCGDATYNVVDITPTQMIIVDEKSREKINIRK